MVNGKVANGVGAAGSESKEVAAAPPGGVCRKAFNHLLTGILFSIILVGVVVAVMEVSHFDAFFGGRNRKLRRDLYVLAADKL